MIPVSLPFIEPAADLVRAWWKALVGAAVVAGPVFLMGQCSGADAERAKIEARTAEATASAQVRNAEAIGAQRAERAADTIAVEQARQERTHASQGQPDSRPSDSRRARACEQLRQQGTDAARRAAAGCP